MLPRKDSSHAWSVADFEAQRPELTVFVREELIPLLDHPECLRILVRAPVKSGKREIAEYVAMRDHSHHPHRVHVFISAWYRTADEEQRLELMIHNMRVFSLTTTAKAEETNRWIQSHIATGKHIVIHVDECDFGAGRRQILGQVYTRFRENNSCSFLLYSATPQEVLLSGEVEMKQDEDYEELVEEIRNTGRIIEYTPPRGYCGPGRFLEEGLVFDATPFFVNDAGGIRLTPQGSQIITAFRENLVEHPSRNIIVLRLSSSGSEGRQRDNRQIYQFLRGASNCEELNGIGVTVAKGDLDGHAGVRTGVIEWSNREYWLDLAIGRPKIFVIDQTASRSTEFVCHDRIFACHDYRKTVVYTTVSQAQERVNHYEQRYGGFQRIRVYGHKKTFQLSVGQITYGEYMTRAWTKKKVSNQEMYYIRSEADGSVHPNYPHAMPTDDAEHVLHELSCAVKVEVAARVRGRIKTVPVYGCDFVACTSDSFQEQIQLKIAHLNLQQNFQNPFVHSIAKGQINGRFQGFLREWRVFDFNEVRDNRGWGMTGPRNMARLTICYRQGDLGVALRWRTNEREEINTLETFRSMYRQ